MAPGRKPANKVRRKDFGSFEGGPELVTAPLVVEDRRSTFQAHLAAVETMEDVRCARAQVANVRKLHGAKHNIVAYRFLDRTTQRLVEDSDDDGERGGGACLLRSLQASGATGVVVVVSRWFGGVQIGADRFKHVSAVARAALAENGFGNGASSNSNNNNSSCSDSEDGNGNKKQNKKQKKKGTNKKLKK